MGEKQPPLEEEEMIEILEGIARSGADTARIQAIKALRAIKGVEPDVPQDDWAVIYGDAGNVTPINRAKRANGA